MLSPTNLVHCLKRRYMPKMSSQAKTKMEIQPRYIISDLLEDILKMLPSKSLMRFKCVSHSFHDLINNPTFGLKQLSHYQQTNNSINILLKYMDFTSSQTSLIQIHGGGDSGYRLCFTELVLPQRPCTSSYSHEFSLVGHCNGVICLGCPSTRCHCGSVVLYNATIRESKVVPQPPSSSYVESQYPRRVKFGFGCDPATNDLVVIMISSFVLNSRVKVGGKRRHKKKMSSQAKDFPGKVEHYTLVEEYSLRTNSWREMKKYNELFFIKSFWVYHKGVYYWTTEDKSFPGREEILKLKSEGKALSLVPMPSNVEFSSYSQTCLGVLHDSLTLVCCNNAIGHFSIWVMNQSDNLKDSWTMIASIDFSNFPDGVMSPFLVPLKGNEILMGLTCGKFIVYDISTKEIKHPIPNSGIVLEGVEALTDFHAINCVQSIISVNRRH